MLYPLEVDAANKVPLPPFVKNDGFTPETALNIATGWSAKLVLAGSVIDVSTRTVTARVAASGAYDLNLIASDVPAVGSALLVFTKSTHMVNWMHCWVYSAKVFAQWFDPGSGASAYVTPLAAGQVPDPLSGRVNVIVYEDTDDPDPVLPAIVDSAGAPIDLSALSDLYLNIIDPTNEATLFTLEKSAGGLTIGGDDNNEVTVVLSDTITATTGNYRYELWDASTVKRVLMRGAFIVTNTKRAKAS